MYVASVPETTLPEAAAQKLDERIAAGTTGQTFQPNVASCPTFNAEATLARVEGNRELLCRMVGVFARQWRRLWAEAAQAGARRDGSTLELKANKLKQSLASFGANEARRVAQELEELGSKSQFHHIEEKCARLKIEIEQLVPALRVFAKEDCNHSL